MHVLLVGGQGQLGCALQSAMERGRKHKVTVWTHREHDITSPSVRDEVVESGADIVVNTAAWTDVDGAEDHPELAYATNTLGPKYLAEGCAVSGADLVHVSTNEVFGGLQGQFYHEYDVPRPESVYARSKHGGEVAAMQVLNHLYIVRVAWLFGLGGNHFPSKIVAAADKFGTLSVVRNEYGNPTYAADAADAICELMETRRYGTYHFVNEGYASRYEFARRVLKGTGRGDMPLSPILSSEWARSAPAPQHAVLRNYAGSALGSTIA